MLGFHIHSKYKKYVEVNDSTVIINLVTLLVEVSIGIESHGGCMLRGSLLGSATVTDDFRELRSLVLSVRAAVFSGGCVEKLGFSSKSFKVELIGKLRFSRSSFVL